MTRALLLYGFLQNSDLKCIVRLREQVCYIRTLDQSSMVKQNVLQRHGNMRNAQSVDKSNTKYLIDWLYGQQKQQL